MQLELRPVFHRLKDRVLAHVFLCMLAYYVQWHMQKALATNRTQNPKDYGSFRNVLSQLSALQLNTLCQWPLEFQPLGVRTKSWTCFMHTPGFAGIPSDSLRLMTF